ncbi:MAG: hypothetical protein ABIT58_01935 [Ferruginibacter sp.]
MQEKSYISASCVISNNTVYKNGLAVFESMEIGLQEFLLSVYQHFEIKYPKFYKMDNLSKLGWLAAEILLKDSFEKGRYQPEDIGVILANANSSLDTDNKYYQTTKEIASPALFVYTLPNIMTGEICIRHNFKGENAFFIFEKFDAGFMQQYVNNLINNNTLQACICGWVELLGDEYKTALMLVEIREHEGAIAGATNIFTKENLLNIYQTDNG